MAVLLKMIVFTATCCEQVVAVFVLVLERKTTSFDGERKINDRGPVLDIPLAGFLLGKLFALTLLKSIQLRTTQSLSMRIYCWSNVV